VTLKRGAFVIAWLGATVLIDQQRQRLAAPPRPETVPIVVAAVDLPQATFLRPENLRLTDWPVANVPRGAARDVSKLTGRILVKRVAEGEPILPDMIAPREDENAGNTVPLIPLGMRALAVRVDGTYLPVVGDIVDVISARSRKPILRGVKVLAVGADLELPETCPLALVATLLVTPDQSEPLALAANDGPLRLAKR